MYFLFNHELVATLHITTVRLELITGTPELARANIADGAEFSRLLNAQIPDNWPPPLNTPETMEWSLRFAETHPDGIGWGTWYVLQKNNRAAIGIGGFKGIPIQDGLVEIGYSILPEFQKMGFATEAVNALLTWAFEHPEVNRVRAETLPELISSIRVLKKNGFVQIGAGSEEGVIRFEILRVDFVRSEYFIP
jgi:RimJ/RimL family protein N-acetyltransferase